MLCAGNGGARLGTDFVRARRCRPHHGRAIARHRWDCSVAAGERGDEPTCCSRCRTGFGAARSLRFGSLCQGGHRLGNGGAVTLTLNLLSVLAVGAGAFFFLAGTVGLLRFPDPLSRLHALTKADNLGLGFIVFGLLLHATGLLAAMKLIGVWLLTLLAGATVSQLIAGTARST